MSRTSLSPKERQARLDAAHDRLQAAVRSLQSSEEWTAYLKVMARFTRYSLGNTLLIYAQRPDASQVAGFTTWKSLGRHVRKGAKGITIIAPCTYKVKVGNDDAEVSEPSEHEATAGQSIVRGWRVAYVFDLSDTEGDDLPEIRTVPLAGEAPEGMIESLMSQVAAAGFAIVHCAEIEGHTGSNGLTNFATRVVMLATANRSAAQQARTLAHELAHVLLHNEMTTSRAIAEVEAESVAFLVAEHFGLVADGYTVPYIAHWSSDPEAVKATAERVLATARTVIDSVEGAAGAEVVESANLEG